MTNRFVYRLSQFVIIAAILSACNASENSGSMAVSDNSKASWTVISDKTYGGAENDYFTDILPLPDGGFIATGSSDSFEDSNGNGWVIRADADGAVKWENSFAGAGGDVDILYRVLPMPNGDVVVTGIAIRKIVGNHDLWAIRIDGDGEVIWEKFFGDMKVQQDFSDALVLSNGNLVLIGTTEAGTWQQADCLVVVIDPDGNTLWTNTFGDGDMNRSFFLREIEAAGVEFWIHTRDSVDINTYSQWVIQFDSEGNQTLKEDQSNEFKGDIRDMKPLSNGDAVAAGYVVVEDENAGGELESVPAVLRFDKNLNQIWQQLYRLEKTHKWEKSHELDAILPLGGDRYLIAGSVTGTIPAETNGSTFYDDLRFMEIGGDGRVMAELSLGGAGKEKAHGLKKMKNGDVLLFGQTSSKGSGKSDGQVIRLRRTH